MKLKMDFCVAYEQTTQGPAFTQDTVLGPGINETNAETPANSFRKK